MRFSDLRGKRIGAWGAGREIASLQAALAQHMPGTEVTVVAGDGPGEAAPELLADCDVVVRSPGVSTYRPELAALRAGGVTVTTATALFMAEVRGHSVVGVTGTKGKSTTASLIHHLLRSVGHPSLLAGNIGAPALDLLALREPDAYVIELSSFQIADLDAGPSVAVFTNLHREHVDWHGSGDVYFADKLRLASLPEVRAVVYCERDPRLVEAFAHREDAVGYGGEAGWSASPEALLRDAEPVATAAELSLLGEHNSLNLAGALTALGAMKVRPPKSVTAAMEGFEGLPHRLEAVAEVAGVAWVNDSISTTPHSTFAALAAHPDQGIVLIGGGHDRDQDYGALGVELARRDARVIGVGATGPRVVEAAAAAGVPEAERTVADDLAGAVEAARRLARPGDVVLLSPAAPSFGEHRDFEARGEHFRALVAESLRDSVGGSLREPPATQ